MEDKNEIYDNYLRQRAERRNEKLTENATLIQNFIDFCETKQIKLTKDNFDYIQTIGIVANYPNLVTKLNDKIIVDKEELVDLDILEKEFEKKPRASGYYYSDRYMVMAHPYFRRGHNENSNFSPRFIDLFWSYNKKDIQKYLAIDNNRVRVNVDNTLYLEFDTWYGAKFKDTISDIEDGIVKLRPPLDIASFDIKLIFGDTYSLDIKWATKQGIKVFQAEEFKTSENKIKKDGIEYYPVKYIHAEFDSQNKVFRHFDGAIHFYTEEEYYQRRDNDFNYNSKNSYQLKTLSQKLFKINGHLLVEDWVTLVSHYLTGNPLIIEYFEGKLPDYTLEILEKLATNRQQDHNN